MVLTVDILVQIKVSNQTHQYDAVTYKLNRNTMQKLLCWRYGQHFVTKLVEDGHGDRFGIVTMGCI